MDARDGAQLEGDAAFGSNLAQRLELVGGKVDDGRIAISDPVGFDVGADLVLDAVVGDAAFGLQGGQQIEDVSQRAVSPLKAKSVPSMV